MQTLQSIDRLDLPEIDAVRRRYKIPVTELCAQAQVHDVTYRRWIAYLQGKTRGSKPLPSTLCAVRRALKDVITLKIAEEDRRRESLGVVPS